MIIKKLEIFCKFKNRKIPFEECVKCGKCLPSPIIKKLGKEFVFEPNRYGVTELTGCLRKSYYYRTSETFPSLKDLYVWARGLSFHQFFSEFGIKELKLVKRFDDFDIVGICDGIEMGKENTLFEIKSVSHLPVAPYPQHVIQTQGYYSLAKDNIEIDKLIIIYLTMNDFTYFEVEKKDIMDFLERNARILHNALKNNKPPKEKDVSLCRFCQFKLLCKTDEIGGDVGEV